MDLYPAVLAFLKDHGLHKTATMLEREADCQIPVEAHPNLLDLYGVDEGPQLRSRWLPASGRRRKIRRLDSTPTRRRRVRRRFR